MVIVVVVVVAVIFIGVVVVVVAAVFIGVGGGGGAQLLSVAVASPLLPGFLCCLQYCYQCFRLFATFCSCYQTASFWAFSSFRCQAGAAVIFETGSCRPGFQVRGWCRYEIHTDLRSLMTWWFQVLVLNASCVTAPRPRDISGKPKI